ncbi:MAG TPA: trypsin-like peptidase domain-containing protein [Vicinamibacterales bacterium]|nr:trypsin-like peptidase domain-containing protein [Vicinamibacterales bacterium]
MKRMLTLAACLVISQAGAAAERAPSPADATVFIRLVGSVHVELEDAGSGRQTTDLDRIEIGTGSGFVISPHGYVLTNEHVISNSEFIVNDGVRKGRVTLRVARIDVCFPTTASSARGELARCFEASVHSSDAALDLAVLYITASDLPYVAMGDSDVVRNRQAVEALGYPFGRKLDIGRVAAPDLVPELSVSSSTISALRSGDAGERRVLQINGTVNPGNSGGPLVDQNGFAVGVIRARVTGDAGIAFAIPINLAKDFLESRGLESLMPSRRFRPGPVQALEGKGISLRLPESVADTSPFRSRVESDPGPAGVALRIDRAFTPFTTRQLEESLLGSETFERVSVDTNESQIATRGGGAPLLAGRADGTSGRADIRMQYGVLDLGAEKLVARYVGSAEQIAYSESVFRDSLLSLDGQRLTTGPLPPVEKLVWSLPSAAVSQLNLPLPAGWTIEPAAPSQCMGLPRATVAATAYPERDVTVALRAAVWDATSIVPESAASACSSRRGSSGATSYALVAEWLGVSYSIEGAFVRLGQRQAVQLEVIAPGQKVQFARALLAEWLKKVAGP